MISDNDSGTYDWKNGVARETFNLRIFQSKIWTIRI